MRLDKKAIGHHRPEAAERGHESGLAEFLAETEVEIDSLKMQRAMFFEKVVFDGNPDRAENEKRGEHPKHPNHSSPPEKDATANALYTVV